MKNYEEVIPNPEFLIKSIAEQGYSLETALADLIDNSIAAQADKIEILLNTDSNPFTLYLADNGNGMKEQSLKKNMLFPSNSLESIRRVTDLGRFGLGMKTASFSQTRRFTVLSKEKGSHNFSGRTWDVDFLRSTKKWRLIVNPEDEIDKLLSAYRKESDERLQQFDDFEPNTIVVWQGLYKFENYIDEVDRSSALKKEINDVTSDYLSLVFHRFMEEKKSPLRIRINNRTLTPFNPFPTNEPDFRPLEYKQRRVSDDSIKLEGFILPSRSINECKNGLTIWTTPNRGLMDMEGIYIYRANRIIHFGGWNGLIKKAPRLQLARLRVEVGNSVDHLLHLNVSKSKIAIPHDLKEAFANYVVNLKEEAEREYYNRGLKHFGNNKNKNNESLFNKRPSSKGVLLELNNDFHIVKSLKEELSKKQLSKLNLLIRMVNTRINVLKHSQVDSAFVGIEEKDGISLEDLISYIYQLKDLDWTNEKIKKDIILNLGYTVETLPDSIVEALKKGEYEK